MHRLALAVGNDYPSVNHFESCFGEKNLAYPKDHFLMLSLPRGKCFFR